MRRESQLAATCGSAQEPENYRCSPLGTLDSGPNLDDRSMVRSGRSVASEAKKKMKARHSALGLSHEKKTKHLGLHPLGKLPPKGCQWLKKGQ